MKIGLCLRDLAYMAGRLLGPSDDDAQSYTNNSLLDGLNGGTGWASSYYDANAYAGPQSDDDAQSYANTNPLDGLNGGTGWLTSYTDR